jgi:outer membrane receptor protein involved in Fe transport
MFPSLLGGWRGAAALILYAVLITAAFAQIPASAASTPAAAPGGTIEGIARDAHGAPLPGVRLTLRAATGRIVARATSRADGGYRFARITPGDYAIEGAKQGFGAGTAAVAVQAGQTASAELTLAAATPGPSETAAAAAPPPASPAAAEAPPAPGGIEEVTVIAKRLAEARLGIEPRIGASTYTLTKENIQDLPAGANTPIDDVILQMPGVDQDNAANGGIHIRNEHLNVQYRIDGVIIPDGVSFFGQDLSTRFVDSAQLITGALPAEYGLRTAGIVDIQSKSGLFEPSGSITMNGGSYATLNPSAEYGGNIDGYNYFVSSDYLQSNHGVNGVTPKYNQIHDDTQQGHAFAYLEKIIDPNNKVSVMFGEFNSWFQIPNNPGQATFGGISAINGAPIATFNSAQLNEAQTEGSQFGAVSYLHSEGDFDFQVSAITKYSSLDYSPNVAGDLAFNGIGQDAARTSWANDLQAEGTYRLTSDHTLRGGILIGEEHVTAKTDSEVLAQTGTDAFGNPIYATTTTSIPESSQKTSFSYSAYLQDEWKALPDVTVNYGGRFDVVNGYTIGNQLSPRFNTVWTPTPSTTLHVGYASYFTPPPQELVSTSNLAAFANTSGEPPVTTNSPIKNESAQYFDGGATQEVIPGLKVGLDLYYKKARNLLDEGQFGAPVILTPFNYHIGINRGVEITTNYTVGNFTYYGNLALAKQNAKGIDSAQFNFTAAQLASADSMFINTDHSQFMTASAGVAYLWNGTRFSIDILAGTGLRTQPPNILIYNGATVPSYEQVNLGITHRFEAAPGGPITLRLSVINLLDENYLLRSMTGVGVFANQYAPRRSAFLAVTKEF